MEPCCKRSWTRLALWLLLSIVFLGCDSAPKKPQNILFILVDDLGWTDLACYGSVYHETPNIDQLAAHGIRFTNAYAANPVCSPTRAAIMTGKNPTRVGITDWIPGNDPQNRKLLGPADLHELPLEETTLAEAFKQQGYKTFFAGKWHLGEEGHFPEDQGFDINKGGHHKGSPPGGYYSPYKNPRLSDGPEGEYLTDRLTKESMHFMEENKEHPFFLFLSFYTVHTPIQANKKHLPRFEQKLSMMADSLPRKEAEHEGSTIQNQANPAYASMVHALDENIGRLTKKLDELGISENTLIIFTSDNGGLSTLFPNRTAPTSVKPLRAGKGWCYEGGIRVPMIMYQPGRIQAAESEVPVISHDLYPTLLQWAGLPMMPEQHIDGISLMPLLQGKNNLAREALFWHYPHYHGSAWKPGAAIRMGNWKLIEFYEEGITELYKLDEDLEESHDLSAKYPDKVLALKQKLKEMQEGSGAKFPILNPNFSVK